MHFAYMLSTLDVEGSFGKVNRIFYNNDVSGVVDKGKAYMGNNKHIHEHFYQTQIICLTKYIYK